ncbi:MAG: 50S ribosomal protein L22 [Candidatus Woesearchaeota archaeon]
MKMEKPQEAVSKALHMPLSFKKSVEVCSSLRGKSVKKALILLERVSKLKESIPFKRYNKGGLGHKVGYGPARYPVNVCKAMIKLVKDVQANAEQKGLNKESLVISRLMANKAQKTMHYGRHRGQMKRTHIEIAVVEGKETKKTAPKKEAQK